MDLPFIRHKRAFRLNPEDPRKTLYFTPGVSRTLQPLKSTKANFKSLWPSPGIWAISFLKLDNLAFTNLRNAELGFFGATRNILIQVPLFCGHLSKAFKLIYFFFRDLDLKVNGPQELLIK